MRCTLKRSFLLALALIVMALGFLNSPLVEPANAGGFTMLLPNTPVFSIGVWSLETDDFKSVVVPADRAADLCAALGISISQGTFSTAAQVVTLNPNATAIVTCDCQPTQGLSTYWGVQSTCWQDQYAQFSFEQVNTR